MICLVTVRYLKRCWVQQLQNFELPVPAVNLLAGLFVLGAFAASTSFALDADVCGFIG